MRVSMPATEPAAKTGATTPVAPANEKSLVVLPLENLSPDPRRHRRGSRTQPPRIAQEIACPGWDGDAAAFRALILCSPRLARWR